MQEYLTPEEIAEELRVKVQVVYGWLRKGNLRGLKVGKYWRVRHEDYASYLEAQANVPPDTHSPRRSSKASIQKKRKRKRKRKPSRARTVFTAESDHAPSVPGASP